MLEQTLEFLSVLPGKTYVDATAGAGGHLRAIAQRTAGSGAVVGIDRDLNALRDLQETADSFGNLKLVHANFRDLKQALATVGISTVSGGILADLGVSSMQLDSPDRGFSFMQEGPLDMRMDPTAKMTAEQLVNQLPERELADIIYRFGEERLSRQIAQRIVRERPITTTTRLAQVVSQVVSPRRRAGSNRDQSHPATRTFQALRMAVNDELASIEDFLNQALEILEPGGRLVLITFHSLEDRLVKHFLKYAASACTCPPRQPVCNCGKKSSLKILTTKPVVPDQSEILANPRSRSAKLRAGDKIS
jgi:16S rRNA (cytosine1402-N4)-methyltransferase